VETTLDHPDIPNADDVWLAMIRGASRSLDIAQFYVSNAPESRLEPVLAAVEAAADRGVAVRLLVEQGFYGRYPESVDRLAARPGIAVRRFDMASRMGGILHAKYFLVDGREAYLGSQNFDWRALTHIQELGVRVRQPEITRALGAIFEADWDIVGGADPRARLEAPREPPALHFPVRVLAQGQPLDLTPLASPKGWLPDESLWDLPRLIASIDGARRRVHVQLLTYKITGRDGSPFPDLDDALRRAAARGVEVRLLVADWSKKAGAIEPLQSLERAPHIDVKLVTIPPWSKGFIPYARVVHAKYLVIDGVSAWVGTSNWEADYFMRSRNVGLWVDGASFAGRLDRFFQDGWDGPYATPVDPDATYTPPKTF
jgi:phosphatidylserine/phosphatidylglycerophosphate/cardiolipin synthase-like enzyme